MASHAVPVFSGSSAPADNGHASHGSGGLHAFFERQAEAAPGSIAVTCGGRQISYGDLERRANQWAQFLVESGIKPGDRVGLLVERSIELYVAVLAILKTGAAYVPLDTGYPPDRVGYILSDCNASALVTTTALRSRARGFNGRILCPEEERTRLDQLSGEKLGDRVAIREGAAAYIIYTSGTTGHPKGIEIEHRSVCYLVRTEGELFRLEPSDRVYQGFSIAFDASIEEIWLAFYAGATLVAATPEMAHGGPSLSGFLAEAGVTVLSCVPTLLAMMEDDVPSLRLLILGGEVCTSDLVKRWWRPGRRVVNTYGPTEATVIATCAECHPDRPVTIGRPIPGALACLLDEKLRPVSDGESGELCLGGPGLALGYVNRPDLMQERFVNLQLNGGPPRRWYRTGDRARRISSGEFEFLGRLDAQVKIRGFRVELSEIEAVLAECPGVQAAAVSLQEHQLGLSRLAAYVVPARGEVPDFARIRERLRERLPAYMIPAVFETLATLPTLTSGKIDRQKLPAPRTVQDECQESLTEPRTPLEQQIAALWKTLIATGALSVHDDFFLDLGGHSLLAAQVVSRLRKCAPFQDLSMLDLYQSPTIAGLAAKFAGRASSQSSAGEAGAAARIPFWRHFLCGTAQLVSLFFVLSFFAVQWLAPYLTYTVLVEEEYDFITSVVGALASLVAVYPLMLSVPLLVKWLVIGRFKPGRYPLWGSYYFRWWLVTTIEAAVPVHYLAGTQLLNLYYRLMGAKVGNNVHLHSNNCAIYDLLTIGSGSSINADSNLLGYSVQDGYLHLGRITIGRGCFVGVRATMAVDTVLEDGAALEDLSLLPTGQKIPGGETWCGSPAGPSTHSRETPHRPDTGARSEVSGCRRFLFGCLHGAGLLIFPVLVVGALFPGIVLMNHLNYLDPYYWYLLLSPLVAVSFILLLCLEIALLKWAVLGRVAAGQFPVHSLYYFRKWFVDQTLDLSLDILGPLYASVYLTPWYKLLGAKLGSGAEISTASFISPDLLAIGEDSFIADNVSLGAGRVRDGLATIGRNHVGRRAFVGNSALLPAGAEIGDGVLIGCLSLPPSRREEALAEDTTWLGSPPVFLPARQKSEKFGVETTYSPKPWLRVQRATIEFVRVILPSTCFIILLSLLFSALLLLHDHYSMAVTLCFFPLLYLGCGLAATGFTILLKWALVWRYRSGEKPLWSTFVWRNELLNALHEHLAGPFLVDSLSGTPFICWYFRLLGAQIGRRVYMETTDLSEFDLVRIGDEAVLNADCTIQTHLFEDRVMKMSSIEIGAGCNVGAGSLILYDTEMEAHSSLEPLSLLMKGEVLPAATRWRGIPARAVKGGPEVSVRTDSKG